VEAICPWHQQVSEVAGEYVRRKRTAAETSGIPDGVGSVKSFMTVDNSLGPRSGDE